MRTVKDVLVATATGNGGNLAAIKADSNVAHDLWLRLGSWFCHCTTQVKPCKKTRGKLPQGSERGHYCTLEKDHSVTAGQAKTSL